MSCALPNGSIFEESIAGYMSGNGKTGVRGHVVSREEAHSEPENEPRTGRDIGADGSRRDESKTRQNDEKDAEKNPSETLQDLQEKQGDLFAQMAEIIKDQKVRGERDR